MRRAAALTAEQAAQLEQKVSVVCDHPPGVHNEPAAAPSAMPQVAGSPFSLSDTATVGNPFPATRGPFSRERGVVNFTGGFRGARLPAATRSQEAAALRQRRQDKKEEAWELFRRQASLTSKQRDESEQEYRRKVLA